MIDIVIPTIHACPDFLSKYIGVYLSCHCISRIIIIDNNINTPQSKALSKIKNPRVIHVPQYSNIFVNNAWNIGAKLASSEYLAIINDDVVVHKEVFEYLVSIEWSDELIVCAQIMDNSTNLNIRRYHDCSKKIPVIWDSELYSCGHFLMMKRSRYKIIPDEIKIFFGDDYLLQCFSKIYILSGCGIDGSSSTSTLKCIGDEYFRRTLQNDFKFAMQNMFGKDLRERLFCHIGTGGISDKNVLLLSRDTHQLPYCIIGLRIKRYCSTSWGTFVEQARVFESQLKTNQPKLANKISSFNNYQEIKNSLEKKNDAIQELMFIAYHWIVNSKDLRGRIIETSSSNRL
ncbi:glycosyltransferase [Synechococcus sp. MU1642]|uniref:glycosyltransferase n=1 Tax=Synechococcus sp. MU1642 TaxID=2508348 RepID=UPI001CF92387|nr:glycosyltransferase [Synechococcus sp. MU1642]MCB4407500.1 glycosyltransferase family 2 protein [Synechococcus sp. MU1642]